MESRAATARSYLKLTTTNENGLVSKTLTRWFTTVKLVRLAGIEPTTPWFVAKYSIQLSYSRENKSIARPQLFLEERFLFGIQERQFSPLSIVVLAGRSCFSNTTLLTSELTDVARGQQTTPNMPICRVCSPGEIVWKRLMIKSFKNFPHDN